MKVTTPEALRIARATASGKYLKVTRSLVECGEVARLDSIDVESREEATRIPAGSAIYRFVARLWLYEFEEVTA